MIGAIADALNRWTTAEPALIAGRHVERLHDPSAIVKRQAVNDALGWIVDIDPTGGVELLLGFGAI